MNLSFRRVLSLCALVALILTVCLPPCGWADPSSTTIRQNLIDGRHPKLVVILVFDQLRGDYLTRFADLFLPPVAADGTMGGFRYLMNQGAFFVNSHYTHFPLHTAVGHSVISTGGLPSLTGIVGNEWYDPVVKDMVYCTEDAAYPTVGAAPENKHAGTAPTRLHSTTISDELKMATGLQAHCVSVSLKDRASILLAGHLADTAIWLDQATGNFVSSTYYTGGKDLPAWVQALNAEHWLDRHNGAVWERLLPAEAYVRSGPDDAAGETGERTFPHKFEGTPGKKFYGAVVTSPYGNELTFHAAAQAVKANDLGRGTVTDLLTVNFASNDYVGHMYGPYSHEAEDITLRTDRQLSAFLGFLNEWVPGGLSNVLIVVTADHGVSPVPSQLAAWKINAGRISNDALKTAVTDALSARWGKDDWVASLGGTALFLSPAALAKHKVSRDEADETAAEALRAVAGMGTVLTRPQLLAGAVPATLEAGDMANGYYAPWGADVLFQPQPNWLISGYDTGTSHGTTYVYDTHVPLIFFGPAIRPGIYLDASSPQDIAPTVATLLGIEEPSASSGRVLWEAVEGGK